MAKKSDKKTDAASVKACLECATENDAAVLTCAACGGGSWPSGKAAPARKGAPDAETVPELPDAPSLPPPAAVPVIPGDATMNAPSEAAPDEASPSTQPESEEPITVVETPDAKKAGAS